MIWGSLVDATLLQPEEIDKCFAVSPYSEFRSAEAKAWRDAQTMPIVKPSEIEAAYAAACEIRAHKWAGPILDQSAAQVSCLMEGEEPITGEPFLAKCRVDLAPCRGEYEAWLFDLKTTGNLDAIPKACADFGYHVQAAFYLDLWNACTNQDRDRWGFIFQQSAAPYEVRVVELDREDIQRGRESYLKMLTAWCAAHKHGVFPDPWNDEIQTISLPKWSK